METTPIELSAETTPNPHTLKFNVNRTLVPSGSLNFPDAASAKGSPLAERLFQVEGILGVMAGRDFITVTKLPSVEWEVLAKPVSEAIRSVLSSETPPFAVSPQNAPVSGEGSDDAISRKIRDILDIEIRPAVAMDGGDIVFYGYRDGVVTLHLQGSCSACPSAGFTLRLGVENRLKQLIPEVREVVEV